MDLQWVKGTDDYLPEVQIVRERVIRTVREIFERFGFNPVETPVLNYFEILSSKYAGGAEILKETFHLTDMGGRELCLRYDLTVPFAALIGMHQGSDFPQPFKRYEIGKIFRDGPVKKGRRVEFTQCDADVSGIRSVVADAELISIADQVFRRLGIEAYAEVNNRKLLSALILEAGIPENQRSATILSVDKLAKIGREGVTKELEEKGVDAACFPHLFGFLDRTGDWRELLDGLECDLKTDLAQDGIAELREFFNALEAMNVEMDIRLAPSLARGLEIYTGPVFEFFLKDQSVISSSIGSGGRYDKIIGQFLYPDKPQRHEDFPATGISFGLEPITIALLEMQARSEEAPLKTGVQALIAPLGTLNESLNAAAKLREAGIRTEVAHYNKRLKKTLNYANRMNIPYVIIIGEDELSKGVVVLREMENSEQTELSLDEAISQIESKA